MTDQAITLAHIKQRLTEKNIDLNAAELEFLRQELLKRWTAQPGTPLEKAGLTPERMVSTLIEILQAKSYKFSRKGIINETPGYRDRRRAAKMVLKVLRESSPSGLPRRNQT